MTTQAIRFFKPVLPTSVMIAPYIDEAHRTGQFSNGGPLVSRLEERLAEHFGVEPGCVALCSSGTTALEGALATASGHSASTLPSWTFTATASAALRSSPSASFVDVDAAQRAVFPANADLAIDVLPFGAGPDWDRVGAPARTGVVDAAASFDACASFPFPDRRTIGVIVSLHATKALPVGEGGVFFSNDRAWVDEFRRWTNFGMWGSRVSDVLGTNGKMSELTGAVAHASLDSWPTQREQWLAQSERSVAISRELGILPVGGDHGFASPYWNIALPDDATRRGLERFLAGSGIETRRWWGDGCHTMPAYRDVPRAELPMTQFHSETQLGLPFHLGLTEHDFDTIGTLVARFLDGHHD